MVGRDTIQSLHPELDLSGGVPPGSKDPVTEGDADAMPEDPMAAEEADAEPAKVAPTSGPTPTREGTPVAPELFPMQEVDSDE